jgi:hypothetical protein
MSRITDELIDGKLFFYHSAKGLDAYKYLINDEWRTSSGLYGHAMYGNLEPLWEDNFSGPATDQNKLYGRFRFKVHALRPRSLLFCNVKDGAKILAGYDADYAQAMMEDHGVPKDMIDSIMRLVRKEKGVFASSTALKPRDNASDGALLAYGFNGFVYDGNLDGKTVVFYDPHPTNVRFEGLSLDDGKTFMDIPKGTTYNQFLKLVDDFKNHKKSVSFAGSQSSSQSSVAGNSSLLPSSTIKYMDRPTLQKHLQKVYDLEASFYKGAVSLLDMVFIESWYIRFNLKHRRKIYTWVSDSDYTYITLAAYALAYSCVDSVCPLNPKDVYKVLDVKRLLKYLLPFSIRNKYDLSTWNNVFRLIDFPEEGCFVCYWNYIYYRDMLGRFLVGCNWVKNRYGLDLFGLYFDLFKDELVKFSGKSFDDILKELNSVLPLLFRAFMTDRVESLDVVKSVSSSGITYK